MLAIVLLTCIQHCFEIALDALQTDINLSHFVMEYIFNKTGDQLEGYKKKRIFLNVSLMTSD